MCVLCVYAYVVMSVFCACVVIECVFYVDMCCMCAVGMYLAEYVVYGMCYMHICICMYVICMWAMCVCVCDLCSSHCV